MTARHGVRVLMALAVAALLSMMQAVGALATTTDLIDSTPTSVAIDAPAPGESQKWNMSVRNVAGSSVPLGLEITGQSDVLFSGPAPLELTVRTIDGATVVERAPVQDVLGRSLRLPELAAGASYNLVGTVTLPREADNTYQGASGSLKFRFVTSIDRPDLRPQAPVAGPDLAYTGLGNLMPLAGAAALLLAIGFGLILVRRKKSVHE